MHRSAIAISFNTEPCDQSAGVVPGGFENFAGSIERNCRGADVREVIADPEARELITFPNRERATREIRTAVFPAQPFLCVFDLSARVRVHFGKKRASA